MTGRIPLCEPWIGAKEQAWMMKCLKSGFVSSSGPLVGEFEKRFAEYVGAGYAVATASGTAALHVALTALGIGPGDFVVVPDLTFVASVNSVLYTGAKPHLVDVDAKTWGLDAGLFEMVCKRLAGTPEMPKAVIPVHLYGGICDMNEICRIASAYGIKIIEDATESLGATLDGRQAGAFGGLGCFSFNGNKMITTGGGGMVVADSRPLADQVRYLVNQARDSSERYLHNQMGFNYRMSSISAAMGLAQMERLEGIIRRKKEFARKYNDAFSSISTIQTPPQIKGSSHSWWLYSLALRDNGQREELIALLEKNSISARRFFEPLHRQPYLSSTGLWVRGAHGAERSLDGCSDVLSGAGLNLPSSAQMTSSQQAKVILNCLDYLSAGRSRDTHSCSGGIPWLKMAS